MKVIRLFLSALEWVFVFVASFWIYMFVIASKIMKAIMTVIEVALILVFLLTVPPLVLELVPEQWEGLVLSGAIYFMAFTFVSFMTLFLWKRERFQRILNRLG